MPITPSSSALAKGPIMSSSPRSANSRQRTRAGDVQGTFSASLLEHLATLTRNQVRFGDPDTPESGHTIGLK
jgi:hypothetical protein